MDSNSNKTDKYFRDRLGNFEEGPPESNWDSIVQKLGDKRRKKVILLVFRIAAGMAILVSTGLGYYLLNRTGDEPQIIEIAAHNGEKESVVKNKDSENESFITKTDKAIRKSDVNDLTKQQLTETGNEAVHIENFPVEILSASDDEMDINYISQIDPVRIPNISMDSLIKNIDFNNLPSDTGLSAEEATSRLLAQYNVEEKTEEARPKRWSLGSEIAPLYSDRSINSDNSDQINASSIQDFNDSENGILAYAGGIRIGFSTNKRLTIQSGIYYSRYGQEKSGVQPVANENKNAANYQFLSVSNSTGTITGVIDEKVSRSQGYYEMDVISHHNFAEGVVYSNVNPVVQGDAENVSLKQYFDYFEVPLILKYKIIDRKIDISFSGGMVTNFLIGNSVNMINNGKTTRIGKTEDINEVNYLGSFGMGMEYPIKSNFAFTIEPRFRYYINSINKSSPAISVHPFSFGFFAGINYRF